MQQHCLIDSCFKKLTLVFKKWKTVWITLTSNILAAVHRTRAEVWTTPYHKTVNSSSWYAGFALEENSWATDQTKILSSPGYVLYLKNAVLRIPC